MAFALASNTRAPMVLRANRARIDRAALAERLASRGIETTPSPVAPDALRVVGRANVEGTPEFQAGLVEVQDDASQAVAALVPAGESVLDFCAGAGGKSLALAAAGCRVTAADIRAPALAELRRRAGRARAVIETAIAPAAGLVPSGWDRAFPVVLVDAPCSGTGVWRRHPELRPRAARADEFHALQCEIALRAARAVAPGGALVLATCSVLSVEGAEVADRLVAELGWKRRGPDHRWYPHREGTDGFFAAVLVARV
jgi:16S rRNA (cytosine967-C5)-methyltransferase